MPLAVPLTLEPMEAEAVTKLPKGPGWQYEPKWDGFRCLAFRDGAEVHLRSRSSKDLGRYFPEIVEALGRLPVRRFALDGEIVDRGGSFEALQLRLNASTRRVAELVKRQPATLVVFDMLADTAGKSLLTKPLAARRAALEKLMGKVEGGIEVVLSDTTTSPEKALAWLEDVGRGLDGIVAKRLDRPYRPGRRAMAKYKVWKSLDCVLGGIYLSPGGERVEALLFGLYDDEGKLHYVGSHRVTEGGTEMAGMLQPLIGGEGFTGRRPAEMNRWTKKRTKAVALEPMLVAEVSADHVTGRMFRHGARLLRWRTDKRPEDCLLDQIS